MNNGINPNFLALFTENDRIEESVTDDEWEENKQIIYKSTIKIIKRRLDIMWFNLKTLEHYFNKRKDQDEDNSELLQDFTFDEYLSKLKIIYENNVFFFWWSWDFTWQDEYITYILWDMETLDPRVDIDLRYYLRGFIERIDEDSEVKVDLSDLIQWGYCDIGEKFAESNLKSDDKVIIFGEWKTDIEFIGKTMQLLYPEYFDYYTFLDIEVSKLPWWAERIVTYCQSFISAWIINKTIFVFDNDLAWHQAKDKLLKIGAIPSNFCILTYPDIELANNYPTLCPTWIENLNVNWSACSLEMYFCENTLKDNSQNLIPIQWKIFNEEYQKYHWSFSDWDKSSIQNKFKTILNECKTDRSKIDYYDFDNINILLEMILNAFDEKII